MPSVHGLLVVLVRRFGCSEGAGVTHVRGRKLGVRGLHGCVSGPFLSGPFLCRNGNPNAVFGHSVLLRGQENGGADSDLEGIFGFTRVDTARWHQGHGSGFTEPSQPARSSGRRRLLSFSRCFSRVTVTIPLGQQSACSPLPPHPRGRQNITSPPGNQRPQHSAGRFCALAVRHCSRRKIKIESGIKRKPP